jgi:hypothetical protein
MHGYHLMGRRGRVNVGAESKTRGLSFCLVDRVVVLSSAKLAEDANMEVIRLMFLTSSWCIVPNIDIF